MFFYVLSPFHKPYMQLLQHTAFKDCCKSNAFQLFYNISNKEPCFLLWEELFDFFFANFQAKAKTIQQKFVLTHVMGMGALKSITLSIVK